jgi:hypothetical protein
VALYPGAVWRPLDASFLPRRYMTAHNRVNLHVAVSESRSLFGAFNRRAAPSSHFYVAKDGSVEQYVDTDWQAEADLDGNDATISVETAGGVRDAQGEPWTIAQVEALAKLFAWAVKTHGIARQIATDARPGASSRGLSWHRLGIDGNFPRDLPGRVPGAMHYSKAGGKVCPGDAKIRQVPAIFARSCSILDGRAVVPAPTPPPFQEDDVLSLILWLYTEVLDRKPTTREVEGWLQASNGKTSAQLLAAFLASPAEGGAVRVAFREFLGTEPTESQLAEWTAPGISIAKARDGIFGSPQGKARRGER